MGRIVRPITSDSCLQIMRAKSACLVTLLGFITLLFICVLRMYPSDGHFNTQWDENVSVREEAVNNESDVKEEQEAHPPRCRKILPDLWTKNPQNFSYPSCWPIIQGKPGTTNTDFLISQASSWSVSEPHDTASVLEMLADCDKFRRMADFPDRPASKEEANYPLAYVFLPYKNMAQAIRFFRMIYQPQNVYCITYDTKTKEDVKKAILALARCFSSNVFVNTKLEPIYYSTFTLLHSVMECVDQLRQSKVKWKYVQVVSWNDFPLKTNWEMVRIFKAMNGSQDCELIPNEQPHFITLEHGPNDTVFKRHGNTSLRKVPPAGITFYKGSFATSMSREFVQWMFTDPLSIKLYNYFNGSQFPDEFYWPTLIHNVHMNPPGGFPGQCLIFYEDIQQRKPYMSRFQIWTFKPVFGGWNFEPLGRGVQMCKGHVERITFCVYGIGDLPLLITRQEIIAHKLYEQYQPAILYCLEEWYWDKVCKGKQTGFNSTFYENLPAVRYHNLPQEKKDDFVCKVF